MIGGPGQLDKFALHRLATLPAGIQRLPVVPLTDHLPAVQGVVHV